MNLPNFITLVRIALVPVFFAFLISSGKPSHQHAALIVFIAAALSDALDGWLARKLNQVTDLGTVLDALADKLLILAGFIGILLTHQSVIKPPLWIQIAVLFREIGFASGFAALLMINRCPKIRPNILGKCTTFSQMVLILLCLAGQSEAVYFSYLVGGLTILSWLVYTYREFSEFPLSFPLRAAAQGGK